MRVFRVFLVLLFRGGIRSSFCWRSLCRLHMPLVVTWLDVLIAMNWLDVLITVNWLDVLVAMNWLDVLIAMNWLDMLVAVNGLHAAVVMPGGFMSTGIFPEAIIANGVFAPIMMVPFPSVETLHANGIADQPNSAGSQIEILIAHHSHVFAVHDHIIFWHHDRFLDHHWRRFHIDRRRNHNLGCDQRHAPIGINHAARH